MPFGDGQPGEQTPPVVDQGHDARQDLTAPLILGRETSPSPLILQFIEYVLRLRPIPVELRDSQHRFFQRRDQYGVVVLSSRLHNLHRAEAFPFSFSTT